MPDLSDNRLSKIYKYSHAETCRLAVFCVKLTFYSDFTVPLSGRRSCTRGLRVYFVNFLRFYFITLCMHMYVRCVRSLAAVVGRFHG